MPLEHDIASPAPNNTDKKRAYSPQQSNPQLYFVLRYLCLLLAGLSFGGYVCAFAADRVLCTLPPERFEGGQGFALNFPLMVSEAVGLFSFCFAFAMLLLIHIGQWCSLARIPNPLTIVLLLPGLWVMLKILGQVVLRIFWIFQGIFG